MTTQTKAYSSNFAWRRVHSFMGLWLVIYLIEHLIVNSQATLWLGDDGIGFIRLSNLLEALPYLQVIEIIFIAIPLTVHGIWGVKRAFTARFVAKYSDGSKPALPYERSRAFAWQRITSWILLFGIIGHVVQMRFIYEPEKIRKGNEIWYITSVTQDPGLKTVASRVDVILENEGDHVVVRAQSPGKAMLFMVRETFKSPLWCIGYTIFVLAAAFHAFNGFWTSLITWGVMLSYRSQKAFLPVCWIGTVLIAFLGLAAIWGSYWINLRN